MVYIFSLESYRRNQNGVGHFLHTAKSFSFNYNPYLSPADIACQKI